MQGHVYLLPNTGRDSGLLEVPLHRGELARPKSPKLDPAKVGRHVAPEDPLVVDA